MRPKYEAGMRALTLVPVAAIDTVVENRPLRLRSERDRSASRATQLGQSDNGAPI